MIVMTYYNIVHQIGVEAFCSAAQQSGVNGIIAPDLPVEEASQYKEAAMRHGIDTIFLAAPSTSAARLEKLVTLSSGFVYLVSANGITGARQILQDESIASIQRTAALIRGRAPLGVGFGLSLPSHVRQVIDNGASAAIVGSRFAQIVEQNLDDGQAMLNGICECAQTLKDSTLPGGRDAATN